MLKKIILRSLLGLVLLAVVLIAYNFNTLQRVYATMHLFDEDQIVYNFRNMETIFPVSHIEPAERPIAIPENISYTLPNSFINRDSVYSVDGFIDHNELEGIQIIQRDSIIYEDYRLGLTPEETHISWSLSKSVLTALLGIAYDDGLFEIKKSISDYLPQFKGSAYDGVQVKDVLQMSTGVQFNEDHTDFNSDINRFSRVFASGGSIEDFALTLKREREPGTYCHYVSINTQILGMLLAKVTEQSVSDYMRDQLWRPMGMQDSASWILDDTGMEVVLGGLNMSMRDYSKIGLLYLNNGYYNGQQLITPEWIKMSTTPDAPHLMPGKHDFSSNEHGYGFQWFIPTEDEGDYFAAGLNDQFIYVNPKADLVVTILSANHKSIEREQGVTIPHISLCKRIADDFLIDSIN